MDFYELRDRMKKIEMSDETKNRVIYNCRLKLAAETEEIIVKKFAFKRPAVVLAVVVLCLCLAVSVGAAVSGGMFVDVKSWNGAVVGTEYVQASEEIRVAAKANEDVLTIEVEVLVPNAVPYSVFEQLCIGSYRILDKSGAVLAEAEDTAAAAYAEGKAQFAIPFNGTRGGEYVLEINSFVGSAKAEQPLEISGSWECEFVV